MPAIGAAGYRKRSTVSRTPRKRRLGVFGGNPGEGSVARPRRSTATLRLLRSSLAAFLLAVAVGLAFSTSAYGDVSTTDLAGTTSDATPSGTSSVTDGVTSGATDTATGTMPDASNATSGATTDAAPSATDGATSGGTDTASGALPDSSGATSGATM